jgi:cytochrome c-type biogenesis protein CcsB
MKKLKFFFSPLFMGVLLGIFAVSMAAATFIENDFGAGAARRAVYNAGWFEILMLLLAVNMAGRIIILKTYRKPGITVFLFHIAFIVMLAGAAITRYAGYEGTVHIREGEEQDRSYSVDKFIGYSLKDGNGKTIAEDSKKIIISHRSSDRYKKRIYAGGKEYLLNLDRVIPNATEEITDDPSGIPMISFVITDRTSSRSGLVLSRGERKMFGEFTIGFESGDTSDIVITFSSASFFMRSKYDITVTSMKTGETDTIKSGNKVKIKEMQLLDVGGLKIVPRRLSSSGVLSPVGVDPAQAEIMQNAFVFSVSDAEDTFKVFLWEKAGEEFSTGSLKIGENILELFYGSKPVTLPFSLRLNDFILERYPGSNSPSGYRSRVVVIDRKKDSEIPFEIYMNNILKFRGYRVYQSSYDKDEKGTILSVNHDPAGMAFSYSGYGLLFLFIVLSMINKNSMFRKAGAGHWRSSLRKTALLILFMVISFMSGAVNAQLPGTVGKAADEFGRVLVQDQKGRTKPLYTLSNDILRKVTRKDRFEGMSSMQVFLGIYFDFDRWKDIPLIRISNKEVKRSIGITGDYARFSDLVVLGHSGTYKLAQAVDKAYTKSPGERNRTDKEVIKVDERVNIVYMVYTGAFLKIFPLNDDSHRWGGPEEAAGIARNREDSLFLNHILPSVADAVRKNDPAKAKQITGLITGYQRRFSGYDLPSDAKVSAELFYYNAKIFERLFPFYALLGTALLFGLLIMVINGRTERSVIVGFTGWLLLAGFICHTSGLALRWYIAGHAPLSNGYESMIFISWATMLAGFIFRKRSPFTLSATAILASMTLMVAHLSFLDPEITNLVPVLKSYWLTMHVSVITGSYGFLGLGAVLGLITMILISFSGKRNISRISSTVDELTVINFKTLTIGLYLLTTGTFLGAVWANESWGRYWGWDPKETWSLITIVVYAFVTHSRMIKGMNDVFTFNCLALFSFSSVLMTYFGVNYYLSGLHSYAGGDPVPVPAAVYIAVITLAALSYSAWLKYSKWGVSEGKGRNN